MAITQKGDIVYHYCDTNEFLSIVQHSSIWLCDILKSNDSKEELWIREKINETIEEKLSDIDLNALSSWKKGYNPTGEIPKTPYVSCFTQRKDCLSQWRGYAQDSHGLAIGFSKPHLESLSRPHFLRFDTVVYDEKKQQRFIDSIVNENFKKMENKSVWHTALELDRNYFFEFLFFKNPSFIEEEEWRILLRSSPDHQVEMYHGDFDFSKPKFRVSKGKIVSYIEMSFEKIKADFIKEIWIGPKADATIKDIEDLLSAMGYCKKIPIEKSKSTYR